MARVCREVRTAVEEQIEQPVESFVNQLQRVCAEQPCNWWCLCCNKWLCWLAWVVVRVVTFVLVTVTKWVSYIICEIVGFVSDALAFVVNLILSIPILGGILRTIINWGEELLWRGIGLPDLILTLVGVQLPKKMYVKVIILNNNGTSFTDEATVLPFIQAAQSIYRNQCNINLIYTGACLPKLNTPSQAQVISCDAGGFFADWWIAGSYYELVSSTCAFEDGSRRVIGYGGELIAFIIQNVTPDTPGNTIGCSMGPTHNYIVEEVGNLTGIAHELGHACGLPHLNSATNLMNPIVTSTSLQLTTWQRAVVRNSRHCVFI